MAPAGTDRAKLVAAIESALLGVLDIFLKEQIPPGLRRRAERFAFDSDLPADLPTYLVGKFFREVINDGSLGAALAEVPPTGRLRLRVQRPDRGPANGVPRDLRKEPLTPDEIKANRERAAARLARLEKEAALSRQAGADDPFLQEVLNSVRAADEAEFDETRASLESEKSERGSKVIRGHFRKGGKPADK